MTEKRFNSYCDNDNIRIRIDDGNKEIFHIYFAELEDALYCKSKLNSLLEVLNALHEENEQLKKENKELKKENAQFDILIKNNQLAYIDLEKENEQLKRQMNTCFTQHPQKTTTT